jgi:transposase
VVCWDWEKRTRSGGDLRRFYTTPHPFACGIDQHARTMSLCVLPHAGESVLHRQMKAAPEPFLQANAPDREALVVCVEYLFTWAWLADLCAGADMPFVLGHALSMQALHGGQANHDPIAAHKSAGRLRGGMRPQAYVDPAQMRATRDWLRRRMHLMRQRAERLAHRQKTHRQYTLPEIPKTLAYKANRDGVAARFPNSAVQQSLAVDLTLIDAAARLLTALARDLVPTANAHAAQTCDRLRAMPGVGQILARVLRYALHDIRRFPRGQAFVADCRLVM